MTIEEIETFKNAVIETILPHAKYMNNEQILQIIEMAQKNNEELPFGFGNMLFEQIIALKDTV